MGALSVEPVLPSVVVVATPALFGLLPHSRARPGGGQPCATTHRGTLSPARSPHLSCVPAEISCFIREETGSHGDLSWGLGVQRQQGPAPPAPESPGSSSHPARVWTQLC